MLTKGHQGIEQRVYQELAQTETKRLFVRDRITGRSRTIVLLGSMGHLSQPRVPCPTCIQDPEEAPPRPTNTPWKYDEPDESDGDSASPCGQVVQDVDKGSFGEDRKRESVGHVRVVKFCEAKGGFAELAVLLVGMR